MGEIDLMILKSIFFELAESGLRFLRLGKFRISNVSTDINLVVDDLNKFGISIQAGFFSSEECSVMRQKIDSYILDSRVNVIVDKDGADHRIFFADQIDPLFAKFYNHPDIRKILALYTGTTQPSGMVLAARIDSVEGNVGSGGGWHRDSLYSRQFKTICYLSSVDQDAGPFQYIKGSHKKSDVLISYFKRLFTPGSSRFTNDEIRQYLKCTNKKVTSALGFEGSVVHVDTKGVHRGKPIKNGSRYALTCYFWHGKVPAHMNLTNQQKISATIL